jgi:hypothetical protein
MKCTICMVCLFSLVALEVQAGERVIFGSNGPVTVGTPYTGVVNKGTISGGTGTGLTVTGTASKSVVNKGLISGSTGVRITGSSSSSFVNTGTISATSSGGSSAKATGVSQ